VPVIRGELKVGLVHFLLTLVTLGLWQFVMAFLYNKQFLRRMLEKGYVLNDSESTNTAALRKLGIQR